MTLIRYDYEISYSPGSQMFIADSLSRASYPEYRDIERETMVEQHICCVVEKRSLVDHQLGKIKQATNSDAILKELIAFSHSFWLEKSALTPKRAIYYNFKDRLIYCNSILVKGSRIVIPESMWQEKLRKIYEGHHGIVKSFRRARDSV